MKYKINGKNFNSKAAVQEQARKILYRGDVDEPIFGEDLDFMLGFFRTFHHQWKMKKGCGIKHLYRITEPVYGKYRAFFIVRVDGSTTDISYRISKIQKQNWKQDFNEALRQVITPQIWEFKSKAFSESNWLKCPLTREMVSRNTCHVDHFNPTFEELVKSFVKKKGISDFSKVVSAPSDNQVSPIITDKKLESDFYDFHKRNANLRITSIRGNLSVARKTGK